MYQVTQKLRSYQQRALKIALGNPGASLVLPTGTGKTLVGCGWACELLNLGEARRVLVLEPSRFLVEQVEQYYKSNTNIPVSKVYGVDSQGIRASKWNKEPLVVATPQVTISDMHFLNFDAVIVDECHHTTGEYAYKKLLSAYPFRKRLGLSATISDKVHLSVEESVGPVHRWTWSDPEIEPYVPEWYGEVYDAELTEEETKLLATLENIRNELRYSPLAGMPSLALRMFARDGAQALLETLAKPTTMSYTLRDTVVPLLSRCRSLHKLEPLKSALIEHDFDKAIVFVDRVCIANALAEEFPELNPVCLLGRLHGGSEAQKVALEKAGRKEVKLVISTSVGEEGIDLPVADLIISWSNTASPVRFIQRKGRGMRVSPAGKDKIKVDIFIGTPDTPDYDSLYFGIAAACKAGVEILLAGEQKDLLKATTLGRIQDCLESRASDLAGLAEATVLPLDILKKHTSHLVREGIAIYIYDFDVDEMLERQKEEVMRWITEMFELPSAPTLDEWLDSPYRSKRLAALLNFHMQVSDRVYVNSNTVPSLAQTEYARLFNCRDNTAIEVKYGFDRKNKGQLSAFGNWYRLTERLQSVTEQRTTYLTFSHSSLASVTVSYHGEFSKESLPLIIKNACWITERAEEAGHRLREEYL